jgi:L-alanine-DL-glutamate epimerase-like enolase superfamily enzyme
MSTKDTIKTIEEIRKFLGPEFTLMLDPNNGYDYQKALEIGKALDLNNYHWLEDPVPWNDFESIKKLSTRLKTPLAMSDQPGFLFEEFSHYLRDGYPEIIRGTSKKFGITGLKNLCKLAEKSNTNCEIGTGGNIFMNMANLHVMMTIKNCDFYEYWMPTWAHDFACIETIEFDENSEISAPKNPGIGLTLNEDWIKNHKVATLI